MTDPGRPDDPRRKPPDLEDPTVVMAPIRPDLKPPAKQRERGRLVLYVVAGVLGVTVLALVVIAVMRSGGSGSAAKATYQVRQDGAVVVAGQSTARTTIDIYEDYLCPYCELVESKYGAAITEALNNGQIQVKYHTVLIHEDAADASNAALCSVAGGKFPEYHAALFDDQKKRGDDELIALGKELGVTGDFEGCVKSGKNDKAVKAETQRVMGVKALQGEQGFGTPTVTVNGKKVDVGDANWLKTAIQQG